MSNNKVLAICAAATALAATAFLLKPLTLEAASPTAAGGPVAPMSIAPSIERGRYLAKTSGCNDCHTAGYLPSAGRVPEAEWLKGDATGWNGPWGTTYASNLRLFMQKLDEDKWVEYARNVELRPPMPWFGLREMHEGDLRSIYRFVRSLGAPGEPAPAYLPPGETPQGVYVQFVVPGAPGSAAAR